MRILFLGANLIGIKCLQLMIDHPGIEVVGALPRKSDKGTVSDKNVWNTSVRRYSNEKGLNVFRESGIRDKDFVRSARNLNVDYIISVQYDEILTMTTMSIASKGCLNLHFSLLPYGRGCFPVPWAMIDDRPIGATLHYIERGIDKGPIIGQIKCDYNYSDTAYTVYTRLILLAEKLFKDNLGNIADGNLKSETQSKRSEIYHKKEIPNHGVINWSQTGDQVDRFIRANMFPSYKSAITYKDGKEIQVRSPLRVICETKNTNGRTPGKVMLVSKDFFDVKVKNGKVRISECSLNKPYSSHLKAGQILG